MGEVKAAGDGDEKEEEAARTIRRLSIFPFLVSNVSRESTTLFVKLRLLISTEVSSWTDLRFCTNRPLPISSKFT